jgi:hypothetical protein
MTKKNSSKVVEKEKRDKYVTSDMVKDWLVKWNAVGETDRKKCPCGCGFTHGQHRMLIELFPLELEHFDAKECSDDWVH